MDNAQILQHCAHNIARGDDMVALEFVGGSRLVVDYGYFPELLRNSWSGFILDLAMGLSIISDLYPGIYVQSARIRGSRGLFCLRQGGFSRNYYCDLSEHPEILKPLPDSMITETGHPYWNDEFPVGFMDELRGNFPGGEPYGQHVHRA